jgi:predicted secreted hydrolase
MLQAEDELRMAQEVEEENDYSDALESMERKYWEGQVDALGHLYGLTYQLSFAIAERDK